ncbi:hypothetical protein [Frateuria soli]|uniref:hypothetical protein n=1 Tax=Frateuria soli TaxID=1542730 RepID=UPI001E62CC97|nr:hypothetical protein [Frateuria soli]UGB37562.1 hypothetical protein LQ771_12105 [Frateuria soli]
MVAAVLTGGVFFVLHQLYVTRTHADALYMDSLRLVYQLERWLAGDLGFLEFWRQGAAHHGFINQLALWANVAFFSLDVELANRASGIAIAGVSSVLVYVFVKGEGALAGEAPGVGVLTGRLAIACVFAVLCFSWAGFELLTLDLGLPLWLKNFSFVLYFAGYSRYLSRPNGHAPVLATCLTVAGPVIVLVLGMGWSYAFVLSVLSVHLLDIVVAARNGQVIVWRKLVPAVALVLALLVYIVGGFNAPTTSTVGGARAPLTIAAMALYALGSSWMGVETASAISFPLSLFMLFGGVSVTVAFCMVWRRLGRGLHSRSLLPLFLLAYGGLIALALGATRGVAGVAAVMASRYFMDLVLFLIGVTWLWYEDVAAGGARRRQLNARLFMAFILAVLVGQALTYWREWRVAPYRAAYFEAVNRAIYLGVPDASAAELLQSPLVYARRGAETLREKRLGLWSKANLTSGACRSAEVSYTKGWHAQEGQARWSAGQAELLLPACGCDFTAQVYLPGSFENRELDISRPGDALQRVTLAPGQGREIHIPGAARPQIVLLSVSRTTVPARDVPGSHDGRTLGVLLSHARFACEREH